MPIIQRILNLFYEAATFPGMKEPEMTLKVGDTAPDFTVADQSGTHITLSELHGKIVVLYFYPKADTPGCTVEACAFRDSQGDFDTADAVILGVSPDTVGDQEKFATKYDLPFKLLADADHAIAEAYDIWGEKSLYGRKYMGVDRATFLIDREGKIAKIWPRVKVDGHAAEVLASIRELAGK